MTFRRDVEQADRIRIVECDHCDYPHLLLVDEDGDVFAEAVFGDEAVRQMIDWLQKALYQLAVARKQ